MTAGSEVGERLTSIIGDRRAVCSIDRDGVSVGVEGRARSCRGDVERSCRWETAPTKGDIARGERPGHPVGIAWTVEVRDGEGEGIEHGAGARVVARVGIERKGAAAVDATRAAEPHTGSGRLLEGGHASGGVIYGIDDQKLRVPVGHYV